MIRWQPGANYWRPANIRGVRARGLEISAQADYGKILGMQGSYFINATVKTASESNADHTVGNFVPQVPREAFAAAAYFSRAGWRLDVEYRHNGYQYLTFENDDFLPAVGLLHCALQKELYFDRWQFRLSGRGRNLLSESYQIVPGYPQPEHPLYEIEFEIKY
jgi:outer membrane cobalamin receptor